MAMTEGRASSGEARCESGYSSSSSSGSFSDQIGHVGGITVAALELLNDCPEMSDRSERPETPPRPSDALGATRAHDVENVNSLVSCFLAGNARGDGDCATKMTSASQFERQISTGNGRVSPTNENGHCKVERQENGSSDEDILNHAGYLTTETKQDRCVENGTLEKLSSKVKWRRRKPSEPDTSNKHRRSSAKTGHVTTSKTGQEMKYKQCLSGENVNRPAPHVLPPCKVCGIQATGFHYGVNTCEACKGFFRRSIIRKHPYVCANNPAKCVISPGKRKTCPLCRYKKCIEAGMSVDGIKIGRYTYAKRTQDILELKQANMSADDEHGSEPDELETELETTPESDNEQDRQIVEFIDTVIKANDLKDPEPPQSKALIEKMHKQVKDQHAMGQIPKRVPMDQFFNVLSTTGVQLDNRIQVLQQWVVVLNDGIKYLVNFAKMIPGFRELKLADQMALIKHSICEVWIISRHMAFHRDLDYFITVNGMAIDVIKTLGEDFGSSIMKVTRRLQSMDLTKEEVVILKAMVIFFADRCEVHDIDKVNAIRDKLVDSFLYLLNRRDANMALSVGRLSALLTELRLTTEMYQEYTKKLLIVLTKTGVMNFPPLLLEVMSFAEMI